MPSGSLQSEKNKSFKSTNDLTGKQYYAVAFDASNRGNIILANAQTAPAVGILQDEPVANEYGQVRMIGETSFAIAGGTIHQGDALTADSNGKLIATTTAADKVVARALEEAASGDRFSVQLVDFYYHA